VSVAFLTYAPRDTGGNTEEELWARSPRSREKHGSRRRYRRAMSIHGSTGRNMDKRTKRRQAISFSYPLTNTSTRSQDDFFPRPSKESQPDLIKIMISSSTLSFAGHHEDIKSISGIPAVLNLSFALVDLPALLLTQSRIGT